ncbi:MAG: NAD(P)/FAD-dependent oxidoreductase [Bacillota bacterium]
MKSILPKSRLLLVGDGLTNAYLLKGIFRNGVTGFETTMFSPAPALCNLEKAGDFIEGICDESAISLNIRQLCNQAGVFYDYANILELNHSEKLALTGDGRKIPFDYSVLSLDGRGREVEGVNRYALSIQNGFNIRRIKQDLLSGLVDPNITIVGAGKLGIELALAIRHLLASAGKKAAITIIDAAHTILHGYDLTIKNLLQKELKANQIQLLLGRKVLRVTRDLLVFQDHTILNYGYLIWTPYSVAYPVLENSGLTVRDGRLVLNRCLQLIDREYLFGAGANPIIEGLTDTYELKRAPWQEAALILENLLRLTKGKDLKQFSPAADSRKYISLGNGRAVFQAGILTFKGRLAWNLKKRSGRRF